MPTLAKVPLLSEISSSKAGVIVEKGAGPSGERPFCSFSGISKSFDGKTYALEDLNLEVREGELLTCLGPSGSGKTTTLMLLAGFLAKDRGEIFFRGRPIGGLAASKRNLGVVFQSYALFPHMTVAENISFPLRMRKLAKPEIQIKVQRALTMTRLVQFAHRMPHQLSGGQQQRVALARALVFEPDMVLLDEPLAALDKSLRDELQFEIRRLHKENGVTMLYVTHDQTEALTLSDRIAVFNNGKVEQLAAPEELYNHPASLFVAGFIGNTNLLPAEFVRHEDGLVIARLQDGTIVRSASANPTCSSGNCLIAIRPERLHIAETAPFENSLSATVTDLIFQGSTLIVEIKFAGRSPLTVAVRPDQAAGLARGDDIRITWRSSAARCFPAA